MKIVLGIVGLIGSITLGLTHPSDAATAATTSMVATRDAAPIAAAPPEGESVCAAVWVCDEPYGVFASLAACRAAGCEVQCSYQRSCDP